MTSEQIPTTYELQYSLDGINWRKYETEINMEQNGAVYARLQNELYEVVCEATGNVGNIDKELPNEAIISFNKNEIIQGENLTATVSQSDVGVSGIDITKCKYVFTTTKTSIGIENLTQYTESFKKAENDTITLTYSTAGATYYLHVLTVDRAGNMKETISEQGVKINKDTTPPNVATIIFNTDTVTPGSNVTATVSQSDSLSGININNCKYAFTIGNTPLGIDDTSKYTGKFKKETEDMLTLNCTSAGTYYLHVLSVDKVGNKRETISSGIKSTITYDIVRDGNLVGGNPTMVRANTWSDVSSSSIAAGWGAGYWSFRVGWANGFGSLSSIYWNIPIKGSSATIIAQYAADKHYSDPYADVYVFGAGTPPTGGAVWNAAPFSNSYGASFITQYDIHSSQWPNLASFTVTTNVPLNGIINPLYIGFAPHGPSRRCR